MEGLNKLQLQVFGRKTGFVPAWDLGSLVRIDTQSIPVNPSGAYWKPDGSLLYVSSGASSSISVFSATTPFLISGLTLIYTLTLSNNIQGVSFSPNGLFMFLVEYGSGIVRKYTLSTAWDLSTATLTTSKTTVNTMAGIYLKSDGTSFYLAYRTNRVYRYDMSTPWDLSTASLNGFITVSAGESYLVGVAFKPDGTKMFLADSTGKEFYQYDLSTAWDLSTALYVKKYTSSSTVYDIFITDDGHYVYHSGFNVIIQYTMIL